MDYQSELMMLDDAVFIQEVRIREIENNLLYWMSQEQSIQQQNLVLRWQERKIFCLNKRDMCLKACKIINGKMKFSKS